MFYLINGINIASLIPEIISLVITEGIRRTTKGVFNPKVKLMCYFEYISAFNNTLVDPPQPLNIHVLTIVNLGKLPAKNVRVGHQKLKDKISYEIRPTIDFEPKKMRDGTEEIFFPKVIPQDRITITYIYSQSINVNQIYSYVKHDEGTIMPKMMVPVQRYPKWLNLFGMTMALLGIFTLVTWIIRLIIMVYRLG